MNNLVVKTNLIPLAHCVLCFFSFPFFSLSFNDGDFQSPVVSRYLHMHNGEW